MPLESLRAYVSLKLMSYVAALPQPAKLSQSAILRDTETDTTIDGLIYNFLCFSSLIIELLIFSNMSQNSLARYTKVVE